MKSLFLIGLSILSTQVVSNSVAIGANNNKGEIGKNTNKSSKNVGLGTGPGKSSLTQEFKIQEKDQLSKISSPYVFTTATEASLTKKRAQEMAGMVGRE